MQLLAPETSKNKQLDPSVGHRLQGTSKHFYDYYKPICFEALNAVTNTTAQKIKFPIKDFAVSYRFGHIY